LHPVISGALRRRPAEISGQRSRSRTDLRENRAQLVEVHRFGKVEIEASFLASPDVFLFVKSSKGYAFDWLFSFGLSDYLVAAPVWQANVAQDNIELLQLDNLQRALRAIGQRNLVTEMIEQAGQYSQRVDVIFDDQNSQAPSPKPLKHEGPKFRLPDHEKAQCKNARPQSKKLGNQVWIKMLLAFAQS
jgi:hypothetical protein